MAQVPAPFPADFSPDPTNPELHEAIYQGATQSIVDLISAAGSMNVNQGDREGWTPLMCAAVKGYSHVATILLDKGADVSQADDYGYTALHIASLRGQMGVAAVLVNAGASLEAAGCDESRTPLHLAAGKGHSGVVSVLIMAGANLNSRMRKGETPLFIAASRGYLDATKMLLRAKADPLLRAEYRWGTAFAPLDVAASQGHSEVVRELVQHVGIEGCGGRTGGALALCEAARQQHLGIMHTLTEAGVVDTGLAIHCAVTFNREASVKFLLQQPWGARDGRAYVDVPSPSGEAPLLTNILDRHARSPRIVQMLVSAGADTTSAVRVVMGEGPTSSFNGTPLSLTTRLQRVGGGKDATEEQLHRLEAIRCLLLRVDAVLAVSWLWRNAVPHIAGAAVGVTGRNKKISPTLLRTMLTILRRRRRGALLSAQFRWVVI